MDVLQLLKKDHDTVKAAFEKIEESDGKASVKREKLFKSIKHELGVHEKFEEEVFYPTLKENAKTHDLTLEAFQEHHVADVLLEEIADLEVNDEQWEAKVKVLQENIEHHVTEEEKKMFPQAKKIFTTEELKQMGEELLAYKKAGEEKEI
jgi:iron-sulfur cluster repair protein YtfE (RIC family)